MLKLTYSTNQRTTAWYCARCLTLYKLRTPPTKEGRQGAPRYTRVRVCAECNRLVRLELLRRGQDPRAAQGVLS